MKRYHIFILLTALLVPCLNSCLGTDDSEQEAWIQKNIEYLDEAMNLTEENGEKTYEKIVPSWAPNTYVLVHWHNDRKLTENELVPLDNSTVYCKYALELVDGTTVQTSYSSTLYGDSIYATRPNQNIIGFWAALTNMHVGDSVTMVIPSTAAYGNAKQGSVPAYSTLIYHVKLKSIPAYQIPSTVK